MSNVLLISGGTATHICNLSLSLLSPPSLHFLFLRHSLFLPFKFGFKVNMHDMRCSHSWKKEKLPLKSPDWSSCSVFDKQIKNFRILVSCQSLHKTFFFQIKHVVGSDAGSNGDSRAPLKRTDGSSRWTRPGVSSRRSRRQVEVDTGYFWSLCFQSSPCLWARGPHCSISNAPPRQSYFVFFFFSFIATKIDC